MLNRLCSLGHDTIGIAIGCLTTLYFLVKTTYAIIYSDDLIALAAKTGYSFATAFESALILLYVTNLFTAINLIIGIRMKRHLLLLSWLISFGIFIIFYIFEYVYSMAKLGSNDVPPHGITVTQMFIVFALTFAVMHNFWSTIFSLYLQLKANLNQESEERPLQKKQQQQLELQFISC